MQTNPIFIVYLVMSQNGLLLFSSEILKNFRNSVRYGKQQRDVY